MYPSVTGVILAGGNNSRYGGRNKAFIKLDGVTILDRILSVFKELFPKIVLVTNDPTLYLNKVYLTVTDIYQKRSALTGLHTGLFYTETDYAFFSACDTPFLKREFLEIILNKIENRFDVVVPQTQLGMEPLFAAYSKSCIKPVEHRLDNGIFQIKSFFKSVRLRTVSEKALRQSDKNLTSFFNINTPDDFQTALKMLKS